MPNQANAINILEEYTETMDISTTAFEWLASELNREPDEEESTNGGFVSPAVNSEWILNSVDMTMVLTENARPCSIRVAGALAGMVDQLVADFESSPFSQTGLVRAEKVPLAGENGDDDVIWTLRLTTGGSVGFGTVRIGNDEIFVEVRPKIENVNYLYLLALSGRLNIDLDVVSKLSDDSRRDSFLYLILAAYVRSLENFFGLHGGLRRLHHEQREELRSRIKGQVQLPKYLNNISRARPLHVPCKYQTHDVNNLPNQSLLFALECAVELAGKKKELEPIFRKLCAFRGHFAGVFHRTVRASELRQLERLPDSFLHYRKTGALPIAELLIRNLVVSRVHGTRSSFSLSFNMSEIFETAFAKLLAGKNAIPVRDISQMTWSFCVGTCEKGGKRGSFRPDIVLPGDEEAFPTVIDTKWKSALENVSPDTATGSMASSVDLSVNNTSLRKLLPERIGLKNADIFQIISYAHVLSLQNYGSRVVGALVYPIAPQGGKQPAKESVKENLAVCLHQDSAFAEQDDSRELSIYLVPWNVGDNSQESVEIMIETLNHLRKKWTPS